MLQYSNLNRAINADTIQKIEASLTSQMSKENYLRKTVFVCFVLVVMFATAQNAFAQTKKVHVVPETAKIFYNGHEVGSGSYDIKFKRNEDFVILKFEVPGYITRTVRLFKNNPNKTFLYELFPDEALLNSVGVGEGIDLANKFFSVSVRDGMTQDEVWRRLMNIAVRNFENIEVRDQSAGWIRTAWNNTTFLHQIVRTRLEIQLQFAGSDELTYRVRISSEIADRDCGTNNQCFVRYDRVLKRYEQLISELQTTLGSNL